MERKYELEGGKDKKKRKLRQTSDKRGNMGVKRNDGGKDGQEGQANGERNEAKGGKRDRDTDVRVACSCNGVARSGVVLLFFARGGRG